MARPINADAQVTRHKLVDGGITRFARHGFHGASTRDLAGAAKVNVGTLSYYFKSKQGLYDACVDEVYRRLSLRTHSAFGESLPTELDEIIERVYYAARAERDGIRLLVRQIVEHGRLTSRTEQKHFLPTVETITTVAVQRLGCTRDQARGAAVALGYAVSRFVIQDEASLKLAFGVRTTNEAHARAIGVLCTTAQALLAPRSHKKEHLS